MEASMDAEKRARLKEILAALPGGSNDIEHLGAAEADALNERIMSRCCNKERLVASFVDSLRDPQAAVVDAEGWKRVADFIPESERKQAVYMATDLYGFFQLPAVRVPEALDSGLWTHEVYVVGGDVDWLVGFKHEKVFLQGKAVALAS
jgi:hypothetical protein